MRPDASGQHLITGVQIELTGASGQHLITGVRIELTGASGQVDRSVRSPRRST
jgi:hypothetical protein